MVTKKTLVLIYLITLGLRLYRIGETAVYPDEITWMVKGKETVYALGKFNLDYFHTAWWNDTTETYAIGLPIVFLNGLFHVLFAGTGKYSLNLFSDIFASRLAVVLLHSLLPPAIYYFAIRYFSRRLSLVAALTYAFNPIVIGLDRWVIHDSSLTLFSFLAVSSYALSWQPRRFSVWPGIFLGLAFLAKPNGILPLVSWLVLWDTRLLFANAASFMGLTLLWPQSWSAPFWSVFEYAWRQTRLTGIGQSYFFFGRPVNTLPWWFYLFDLVIRLPLFTLILLLVAGYRFVSRHKLSPVVSAIGIYVLVFLAVISSAAAKYGLRYALPVFPWLHLAAVWGLSRLPFRRLVSSVYLTGILASYSFFPNSYTLFYNRLTGGPVGAQKYDLVGLCLGSKAALEYLDSRQIPGLVAILGCADTGPYHTARTLTKNWQSADLIILETAHRQQFPKIPEVTSLSQRQLLQKIEENGVVTAEIYR